MTTTKDYQYKFIVLATTNLDKTYQKSQYEIKNKTENFLGLKVEQNELTSKEMLGM